MSENSNREVERKYLLELSGDKVNEFIESNQRELKKVTKKCGIVQWYKDDSSDNKEERVRLEIFREKTGFRHAWTSTIKIKDEKVENRKEYEKTLKPKKKAKNGKEKDYIDSDENKEDYLNIDDLKDKKFVLKIRHFLNNVDSVKECVIDEFLIDKHKMNISEKYLMEIELNDESKDLSEEERNKIFQKQLDKFKKIELKEFKEVTEDKNYSNSSIARKEESSEIPMIIQYVENYLKEEQILIAMQGLSFQNKAISDKKGNTRDISSIKEKFKKNDLGTIDREVFINVNKKSVLLHLFIEKLKQKEYKYDDFKNLSAELDSINEIINLGYRISKVYFFTFPDNKEGKFSVNENSEDKHPRVYEYLKEIVNNIFDLDVYNIPLDFDGATYKPTAENFKKIWESIDEIRGINPEEKKESAKKEEILVDVAGGYKYPGIMASFYCIFNDIPFFYKFEFSDKVIKFPKIPVDWDFQDFDEVLSGFSMIEENENLSYEEYYSLPQVLKNIYSSSDSESTLDSVLPMKRIQKSYEKARKMPFGFGQQFLNLIDNHELREYIKNKISDKWSLQWLGDQIPETVEHSQRHSKRLMEFTVNLINCIGEDNFLEGVPFELKDDFYFVLAVAMNVHDLGHTMLEFKLNDGRILNLKGLPSLVRDLHNELSVQMLNDENHFELLDKNGETFEDKYENWEKAKKAIKLVSKYHRGYMPIDKEEYVDKYFVEIFDLETTSLKDTVKENFEDDENWQKLTIMAARWLKFIDGTDVQADRVVDESYHNERLNRTIYEIECLINEFDKNKCNPEIAKNLASIESMVKFIRKNPEDEKRKKEVEKIAEDIEENIIYSQIAASVDKKNPVIKIDNQIRILDEIAFKARQFPHFKKHRSVKYIYPQFYEEKGERKLFLDIAIENKINPEEEYKTYEQVSKDIEKEFIGAGLNSNSKIKKVELIPILKSKCDNKSKEEK